MPKVTIDGIETNYKLHGKYDISVPSVLLIHGACQSIKTWIYQSDLFNKTKKFNFIAIDLPGHGLSSGNGFSSISKYSEFIKLFVDTLQIKDLILIGHSMGGRISQVFILNYPQYVRACVLVGTGARIKVTRAVLNAVQNNFDYFCKVATKNSFSDNAAEYIKDSFYDGLINSNKETCLNDFIACNEFDVVDKVSDINIPTLILCGEEDVLVTNEQSMVLKDKIKTSTIQTIKNSGHFMMIENPKEFNYMVIEFLDSLKLLKV